MITTCLTKINSVVERKQLVIAIGLDIYVYGGGRETTVPGRQGRQKIIPQKNAKNAKK
jgi:hypothetical protein